MRFVFAACVGLLLSVPAVAQEGEPPKPGYILFQSDVPDPAALAEYGQRVLADVAQFNGAFIAVDRTPEAVEGNPNLQQTVIIAFPTMERLWAFWNSPEYAETKKLRDGLGTFNAVVIEGRALPPPPRRGGPGGPPPRRERQQD